MDNDIVDTPVVETPADEAPVAGNSTEDEVSEVSPDGESPIETPSA